MKPYELIHPQTGNPCGVYVCSKCNCVVAEELAEKCCKPCDCGKPSRSRFEDKCSDCWNLHYKEQVNKRLEKAALVAWDGSMIYSEDVQGHDNGWYSSPDDLLEYLHGRDDEDVPEFAFVGRKVVRSLDIDQALERLTEDTDEDAELHVSPDDIAALNAAVDQFNKKYSVTYYEHEYKRKVRIKPEVNQ